jgi:hypothetical protein
MPQFHIRFSGGAMRWKGFYLLGLILCMATLSIRAQDAADPLSGKWIGEWGTTPSHRNVDVVVELKWDGKTLKGTVDRGRKKTATLDRGTFDPKTGVVHLEADSVSMDPKSKGKKIHYLIEGKLENRTLIGTWNHDNVKGDFKLAKK